MNEEFKLKKEKKDLLVISLEKSFLNEIIENLNNLGLKESNKNILDNCDESKEENFYFINPKSIFIIDTLKEINTGLSYLFVYNNPYSLIDKHIKLDGKINNLFLKEKLNQWIEFHELILKFYLENPSLSILINNNFLKENIDFHLNLELLRIKFLINQQKKFVLKIHKQNNSIQTMQKELIKNINEENTNLYQRASNIYEQFNILSNIPYQELYSEINNENENKVLNLDDITDLNFIKEENELLKVQIHILQEELERYYKLKNQNTKVSKKSGAVEKIKNGLEYKIGNLMITNYKSIFRIISLPFKIEKIVKENIISDEFVIEEYLDAKEAENIKNHLSYKLGLAYLSHSHSFVKYLTLPWAIRKIIRDHKKNKKKGSN